MKKPADPCQPDDLITVFQQNGTGEKKIQGIALYGEGLKVVEVIDFPTTLPDFIDEPEDYFPAHIKGGLVLSFLKHPDLADYAAHYCRRQGLAMIASGPRKIAGAHCPVTCCGLAPKEGLGGYGRQFGLPEYKITMTEGRITAIQVLRGASCGATWLAAAGLQGCSPEEALEKVAREVQFHCQADPAAFDPISGHSPLHFAGHVHTKALETALPETT